MQLRRGGGSPVALGAETLPPPSPLSRVTQIVYLLVLCCVTAYIAYLSWMFFTRLEVRGVVVADATRVGAPREGQVELHVASGDYVEAGDLLATIDPQLGCEPSIAEDSRLEQVRHQLRVAEAREDLAKDQLEELRALAPASRVRRALELEGSRGSALEDWQLRLGRAEADLALAAASRESLEQRQAEILAQAALGNTLAPECRSQALRSPASGRVETVFPGSGEFVARGQPVLLLGTADRAPFIEAYPDSDEVAVMGIGQTARVTLPDGQITNGTIVSVSAASLQSPALETSDYVPVENPLRARIEAEDESTAALWRSYLRMDVEVAIRR